VPVHHIQHPLPQPQQQHCRPSVVAAAASAAGAGAQPDSSDGSWFTKVVLPTALVLLVCNMDRICLSVAILPMAQEYGWPATVQVRAHAYLYHCSTPHAAAACLLPHFASHAYSQHSTRPQQLSSALRLSCRSCCAGVAPRLTSAGWWLVCAGFDPVSIPVGLHSHSVPGWFTG
jgi:hypothetical protein